jgi:CBS-domain-containing membrane protein
VGQISSAERRRNEEAIQIAMDRLLKGDLPPDGSCNLKTLATEAGVPRTAFYPKKNRDGTTRPGPYQHLAEEFQQRLRTLREAGEVVDPRIAQIERLKAKGTELRERLAQRDETVAELTAFKERAVSRLAAQHDEIVRLREQAAAVGNVRGLPVVRPETAPHGSCS